MATSPFRLVCLTLVFCLFLHTAFATTPRTRRKATAIPKSKHKKPSHDPKWSEEETYFDYVTRPDIKPIRWEIKTYDSGALAPGYWFVAPYAKLEQDEYHSWNGPEIYDQTGELIWSGAPKFDRLNIYDFRLAKVKGEMMPTMIFTEHADGLVLDSAYNVNHTVDMVGEKLPDWLMEQIGHRHTTNMHDFNVIDNGKTAVMLTKVYENATLEESQAIGFNGECTAKYQGFKEVDVATSEILFQWNPHGHIHLNESTYKPKPLNEMCNGNAGPGGWDILHCNSIDKFPDGDYLLSARHTDTLYKVSHKDGSIVWRLSAKSDDFEFLDEDAMFRRQHHARIVSQNETHTVLTVFNNGRGTGNGETPLGDLSTGIQIALRTDVTPMTAETVAKYDRPGGRWTAARGSVQLLDNGNAFVGWSQQSLQSEHGPDGRLLQEAIFRREGANTYRAYKYEWKGFPSQPPDVHSAAVEDKSGKVRTIVHVSWNGATEVSTWNLYKTNPDGDSRELVASTSRQGFESMVAYDGYASYVIVEGIDEAGNSLGESMVTISEPPTELISPAVAAEAQWLQNHSGISLPSTSHFLKVMESPFVAYILGVISCAMTMLIVGLVWRTRKTRTSWLSDAKGPAYERVEEKDLEDGSFSEDTMVEEVCERMGSGKREGS